MSEQSRPAFPISMLRTVLNGLRLPWDWFRGSPDRGAGQKDDEELAREKLRAQVKVIREALDDDVGVADADGSRPVEDGDAGLLYRPGYAFIRDERTFRRLETFFGDRAETYIGDLQRDPERRPGTGILARLPQRRDGQDDVLGTLPEIEGYLRETAHGAAAEALAEDEPDAITHPDDVKNPLVTPDHLIYVTFNKGGLCPATEPEMTRVSQPWPPLNKDDNAGDGVQISVVDTGLWMGATTSGVTPWMDDVTAASHEDEERFAVPDVIPPYGGHGTFVAGVIQCMAPKSTVEVERVLTHGGAVYESDIIDQLHDALTDDGNPRLVSISAGTHTRDGRALLAFTIMRDTHRLHERDNLVIVAAAGNDSSDKPFWPAAFEWVVGVGSVDPDGRMSDFSNYGSWVKVYARGRDLVNAFPNGRYICYEPENIHAGVPDVRHFKGMAQWSGTSFSTPLVSGLIAARMSATGEDPRTAADNVVGSATTMFGLPVVGPLT